MTDPDLFIINSPLQVLNAIEAREHFGTQDAHLVLVLREDRARNSEHVLAVVDRFPWASTHVVRIERRRGRSQPVNLDSIVSSLSGMKFGRIVMGFYSEIPRHLVHC